MTTVTQVAPTCDVAALISEVDSSGRLRSPDDLHGQHGAEPAHELDAVDVAFLAAVDQEPEVEQVIEDLGHEWEGRIVVQLPGPMAAYDFAGTAQPES